MPYTATSPDIVLCDQLVTFIKDQWQPNAPNEVARVHRDHHLDYDTLTGRKVFIAPVRYSSRWSTRGHDLFTIRVAIVTAEKYPDAADAVDILPIDWVDERCDWWHTMIYKGLDFRTGPTFNRDLQTLSIDMDERYDPTQLAANKVFWNRTEFEFAEQDVSV